jgi:Transcriptional regulator, AbiEi antitoxin
MGDRRERDAQISQLAARQHGHITRQQLLGLGVPARTIDSWLQSGHLIRVHAGVYAVGYRRVEVVALARAAVLACGPTAVLSHASAAALWDLGRWPRAPEVTVVGDRRPKGITVHRSITLTRADTTTQRGVPTTTAARTLTDLKPRLTKKQFASLVNSARLEHLLNQRTATALLLTEVPLTRSKLERDFLAFIRRYNLPIPILNTKLHGFEVDAVFPDHKLIVELDDYATHGDPATFETDRERDAVHLDHGYRTIRITRERFNRREATRLRRILKSRAG